MLLVSGMAPPSVQLQADHLMMDHVDDAPDLVALSDLWNVRLVPMPVFKRMEEEDELEVKKEVKEEV